MHLNLRWLFAFVVSLTPPITAWAASRALLFGGYDAPQGNISPEYNSFASEFVTVARALQNRAFEIEILFEENAALLSESTYQSVRGFDGGSGESIQRDLLAQPPHHFSFATETSLRARLRTAARELKRGDQLFLVVLAHGELTPGATHPEFGVRLNKNTLMDLERFSPEFEKLKSRGVRLGFFISSCYGGSVIQFLSQFGCAMSLSPATNVSYSDSFSAWSITNERPEPFSLLELYERFLDVTRTDDYPTLTGLPLEAANAFSHWNDPSESEISTQELEQFKTVYSVDTRLPEHSPEWRNLYRNWMLPHLERARTSADGAACRAFIF